MTILETKDLRLGDVVVGMFGGSEPDFSPYMDQTVVNVTAEKIVLFRPYVSLADFTCTSGVIHYIGAEKYDLPLCHPAKFALKGNIFRERKIV